MSVDASALMVIATAAPAAHAVRLAVDEVLSILHKKEVSSETISKVKELLEAADTREFAAEDDSDIQLKEWFVQVKVLLKRIRSES